VPGRTSKTKYPRRRHSGAPVLDAVRARQNSDYAVPTQCTPHSAAEAIRVTQDIATARRSSAEQTSCVSLPRECEAICMRIPAAVHRHRVASRCGARAPSFGPSGVVGTVQPGLRPVCRGLERPRSGSGKRVHVGCLAGARRCRTLSECS
jgi:hypothetical protein